MRAITVFVLLLGLVLPLCAQADERVVGRVDIPYLFGDGGMVALQAGVTLPVTWYDAPDDAVVYIFLWRSYFRSIPALIGIDINPADGVAVQWKIPENIGGMPYGVALYADGMRVISDNRISGLEYGSGIAPPEGICSAGSSGMEGTSVFADSTTDSAYLGQLQGYAPALQQIEDAQGVPWLQIELSPQAIYPYKPAEPLPETGWLYPNYVRLFGDCGFLDKQ